MMNEFPTKKDVVSTVKSYIDCYGTCSVAMPEKDLTLSSILIQLGADILDISPDRMLELLGDENE